MELEELTWHMFYAISNADNAGYEGTAQALREILPDVERAISLERRLEGTTLAETLAAAAKRLQP